MIKEWVSLSWNRVQQLMKSGVLVWIISRKFIVYHFSKQMITDTIVQVLKNNSASQGPKGKVILYADWGLQYTSQELKKLNLGTLCHSIFQP